MKQRSYALVLERRCRDYCDTTEVTYAWSATMVTVLPDGRAKDDLGFVYAADEWRPIDE